MWIFESHISNVSDLMASKYKACKCKITLIVYLLCLLLASLQLNWTLLACSGNHKFPCQPSQFCLCKDTWHFSDWANHTSLHLDLIAAILQDSYHAGGRWRMFENKTPASLPPPKTFCTSCSRSPQCGKVSPRLMEDKHLGEW